MTTFIYVPYSSKKDLANGKYQSGYTPSQWVNYVVERRSSIKKKFETNYDLLNSACEKVVSCPKKDVGTRTFFGRKTFSFHVELSYAERDAILELTKTHRHITVDGSFVHMSCGDTIDDAKVIMAALVVKQCNFIKESMETVESWEPPHIMVKVDD